MNIAVSVFLTSGTSTERLLRRSLRLRSKNSRRSSRYQLPKNFTVNNCNQKIFLNIMSSQRESDNDKFTLFTSPYSGARSPELSCWNAPGAFESTRSFGAQVERTRVRSRFVVRNRPDS